MGKIRAIHFSFYSEPNCPSTVGGPLVDEEVSQALHAHSSL